VPDVRPYYQRAWLQMVPLLIGGGTRLKIVESLSLGTPVVSTTIGAQGLVLEDELHILLADTPTRFAEAVARVLKNESLRTQLSEQGRARVLERYSWPKLGGELSEYLVKLVENHGRRSA
jgi:glycosyltransferase involved in cell wall biosynthesis